MHLFILYILVVIVSVNVRSMPEPLCPKFSYDQQLLEKMVRVEFNVNNMEKNMLETETRIKETEQKMAETRTELMGTKDTVLNTLKEINEKLDLLEQKKESTGKDVVAFHAHKIADKSVTNKQVFVFTEVLLNEGSGYSSTDGYFTAPVSGIYYFNCHLCVTNKKNLEYIFVVNSKTHASGLFTANGEGRCTSFSVTVRMRSSERAWVTIDKSGSSSENLLFEDSDDWNYFSGFLVRQTA
ncbi:cerebellin-3-like isoform X2 [Ruditapes philippinarum]|uniref:cerebellin-3-like isoform X2 n=1 Tax=Ruditapes philippinarum TaxID=129788 RepID=UPI00295ADB4C|nr:cerebellin-3-like isoform X2 [Ruditapes philippinarum]